MATRENREIGLRIKKVREALGISQMKLAEAVGVSFQQIQKYESGMNKVSVEKLKKLSHALNAPLTYFIGIEHGIKREKGGLEEEGRIYGEVGFEELSAEEIHLLLRFRSVKNEAVKEGVNLLLKGIEQIERRK